MFSRRQRCSSWIRAWWVISLALSALLGSTSAYSSGGSSFSNYYSCSGSTSYLGDGYCDSATNEEDCGYDGGDCCSCTCIDGSTFDCGTNGFNCIDLGATCYGEYITESSITTSEDIAEDSSSSSSSSSYPSCSGYTSVFIGDGDCDPLNNNNECGYDGGDCCSCTCTDTVFYDCGSSGFNCVDLGATCYGEYIPESSVSSNYGVEEEECIDYWISDGYCDGINNTMGCSYDGGDCCVCTCVSGDFDCDIGFNCIDPEVDCTGAFGGDDDSSLCSDSLVGDGSCDSPNNNAACLYDGGDCCSGKKCNTDDCIDPSASCSGTASIKPSLAERSRSNLKNVFIGVGAGCVGLIIAACCVTRCVMAMLDKRRQKKAQQAPATIAEQ